MAVFGVPAAHDDDADRAVRAAFACRARIEELNGSGSFVIELRIGVNSGEAVAGTDRAEQFLVTGTPVTLGARLQQAAVPGEILVGGLTQQLTSDGVRYGTSREIDVKGFGRIQAWPVQEIAGEHPEPRRGIAGHRAPFIGRDRELRLLRDALARVVGEGAPSLVTIYGPPGGGKSRLAVEFVREVGHERVRNGRCLPYGAGITLYPIQQILRADLGIELTATRDTALQTLREGVAVLIDDRAERKAVSARLEAILGLAQPAEVLRHGGTSETAEELRWGVRRYLERRAAQGSLVLVFEDIHWADAAMLDLVEYVAEWSRAPILILALARPEFRDLRPAWGSTVANSVSATLVPLTADDTRRLIAELLTVESLPDSIRGNLISRAEGNPLYVEEFLRMLIDSDRIAQRDGRWVAISDAVDLNVPPTVQGLITARLDRVPPDMKRMLQNASLIGRLFSTSALAAVGGEEASDHLLRDAVRRDLLVEAEEHAPGDGRVYRFRHVLIRDVTYGTIPKRERARMHDNYARWLEMVFGDRSHEFVDLIAYHAEQAFLLARELGQPETSQLGQRALDRLLAAATTARPREDTSALDLYGRAAFVSDAWASPLSQRAEAHGFAAAYLFLLKGDRSQLPGALALCDKSGPSEALLEVLEISALAMHEEDREQAAELLWERAVDIARRVGDPEMVAEALMRRATGAYKVGDLARSARLFEEALTYMRTTNAKRHFVPCLLRHNSRVIELSGDFTTARANQDEIESEPDRSKLSECELQGGRSFYEFERGEAPAAVAAGELALAAARDLGGTRRIGGTSMHLGEALFAVGDFERARSVLEQATLIMQSVGSRGWLPEVAARCARACVRLADLVMARKYLDLAENVVMKDDIESQMIIGVTRAELRAAEGDPGAADATFRDTIAVVAAGPFVNRLAQAQLAYAEFLIRERRFPDARAQLFAARDFYHDPLAQPGRDRVDALLKRCEVAVP